MVEDFPAPFGPRKPNASPRNKIKVDPVHGGEAAEPLRQASGANKYLGHSTENTWQFDGLRTVLRRLSQGSRLAQVRYNKVQVAWLLPAAAASSCERN